jgi:ABC-type sulfate/molybdate transport systems ATPase subunit
VSINGDLNVLAQGYKKVHQAFHGEGPRLAAHEARDMRVLDTQNFSGLPSVPIGEPREIMERPANRAIADFVGVQNVLAGEVIETIDYVALVKVNDHELEVVNAGSIAGEIWVLIRPENVTISLNESSQKTSARNAFPGTIRQINEFGALTAYSADSAT